MSAGEQEELVRRQASTIIRLTAECSRLSEQVEVLSGERDEKAAQLVSIHEEYALCRALLMERVGELMAAEAKALLVQEQLDRALELLTDLNHAIDCTRHGYAPHLLKAQERVAAFMAEGDQAAEVHAAIKGEG